MLAYGATFVLTPRAEGMKVVVVRVRVNERGHLDSLGVMHDHALHEFHIGLRARRERGLRGRRKRLTGLAGSAGLHDSGLD